MLTCVQSQRSFSPYLDGVLSQDSCAALEEHLAICPVCRHQLAQTRTIIRSLSLTPRPVPPPDLSGSIKSALAIERAAASQTPRLTLSSRLFNWLEPRLMPYSFGALYSFVLFIAVFGALHHQMQTIYALTNAERFANGQTYSVTWVEGQGHYDVTRSLAPDISAARSPFASESPTINPRGALAALALSQPTGHPEDDEMIVVADVYGNGSASLAAVVEAPRNIHMIERLDDAFRRGPAFVPANMDRRPQSMRVVLVLQKMMVDDEMELRSY